MPSVLLGDILFIGLCFSVTTSHAVVYAKYVPSLDTNVFHFSGNFPLRKNCTSFEVIQSSSCCHLHNFLSVSRRVHEAIDKNY